MFKKVNQNFAYDTFQWNKRIMKKKPNNQNIGDSDKRHKAIYIYIYTNRQYIALSAAYHHKTNCVNMTLSYYIAQVKNKTMDIDVYIIIRVSFMFHSTCTNAKENISNKCMGVSIPLTMRIQMTNGQTYKACTLTTFIHECPVKHLPFVLFRNVVVYKSDQCRRYMHYIWARCSLSTLKQKVERYREDTTRRRRVEKKKQFYDCGNSGVDICIWCWTFIIRLRNKKKFLFFDGMRFGDESFKGTNFLFSQSKSIKRTLRCIVNSKKKMKKI